MIEIDHISIQTLCHATEDENKVRTALQRLYPHFKKRKATGHFGNPIYIFETEITRKREIATLLHLLKENLASTLRNDLKRRMDEKGSLYIRLDKQKLYQNLFVLRDNGEVKIIIHIQSYPFRPEDAIRYAEDVFGY
jgi:RNA binding exosome subunit